MSKKRVLVVDDSATAILWQRLILERESYEVITAANGAEAVRRAITDRPDLVLLDVVMPEMDGITACRAIRASSPDAQLPILRVTTRGDASAMLSAYECGCNEYILKPIDGTELLTKVRSYLERAAGEESA